MSLALLQALANALPGIVGELSASRRIFIDAGAGVPNKRQLPRVS